MKKRILTLFLTLLTALTLAVPAWAAEMGGSYVYDTAGLLTEDESAALEARAESITQQYGCGVYIVTVDDYEAYDSDIHYAAVNIYDGLDLGVGENREGILLMLSMWDRSYDLFVRDGGTAQYAVSDYGRHQMTEVFLDNFGEDDWYGGFSDYLDACDRFLYQAEQGSPVRKSISSVLLPALLVGIGVALAICLALKSMMRSVRRGARADVYVTDEGLDLTERYDVYTHTTETRVRIERDNGGSSDHSGGGGSSTSGHF